MENVGDIDPNVWKEELENIKRERAEERIKQRHNTKSRYVKNLLRFGGNSKQIQQSINDVNQRRQELLKKITESQMQNIDDVDENDNNKSDTEFKEDVMKELEEGFLKNNQNEEKKEGLMGLKFMQRYVEKQKEGDKIEAGKLITMLKQNKELDEIFSEEELADKESNNEYEVQSEKEIENQDKKKNKKEEQIFQGKKVYIREKKNNEVIEENLSKKTKFSSTEKILANFINKNNNNENSETEQQQQQQQQQQEQEQEPKQSQKEERSLEQGINVKNLINKYNKQLNVKLSEKDIKKFHSINQDEEFEDFSNFKIMNTNLNETEFEKEKESLIEAELPEEKPKLKGWGCWAGKGIKQSQGPSPEELLRRKREAIEKKKKERKDYSLDNVILNEKRVKPVSQYFVTKLPHDYKNKEQFDYVNNIPLGQEWNSTVQHKKLTMPKVMTQPGEIIKPINYTMKKIKKN